MLKKLIALFSVLLAILFSAGPAFAHAIVKPNQAGISSFTDFSLGVPSEKDSSTVAIKLMLPKGLQSISPIVKPGWKVEVVNGPIPPGQQVQPDDDGNMPTSVPLEIDWTSGAIPSGQKDFFMFSAQVPSKETELAWKVIQTYSDGSTISWTKSANEQPKDKDGKPDFSEFGPYSKTVVVNDLKGSELSVESNTSSSEGGKSADNSPFGSLSLVLSGLAVVMSALALGLQYKKR